MALARGIVAVAQWGCVACCWPIVPYDEKGTATDKEDALRMLRLVACLTRSK